jgi:hypothetical protein
MNATMMHFATILPDWNSLESVRRAHTDLEGAALVFFAFLVVAEALAHLTENKSRERLFDKIGICFFAIAVLAEIAAFPYGQRNDTLSEQTIGSLDAKVKEANRNADKAVTNSSTALSQAKDALAKAGKAEESLGKAEDKANKAQTASSTALTLAAGARREADSFEKDIVSAKTLAADAESHLAAALRQTAAAEREIAKLKTPRNLNNAQQERIGSKIKPFAGIPFDLWVSTDSDSTALMELIDAILRSAGWKFNPTGNPIELDGKAGVIAMSGISIHVAEEHRKDWEPALLALTNALMTEGIPVVPVADNAEAEKNKKRDRIHVMIGSKPLN